MAGKPMFTLEGFRQGARRQMDFWWRLMIIVFFLSLFARWHWFFDLFTHFRLQQAAVMGLGLIVYGLQRRRVRFGLSVVLLAVFLWPLAGRQITPGMSDVQANEDQTELTVVYANLNIFNPEPQKAVSVLMKQSADILALSEVNRRWVKILKPVMDRFSDCRVHDREDGFGLAVCSRFPITRSKVTVPGQLPIPALQAVIAMPGQDIVFWAAHPPPPIGTGLWRERNRHYRVLARAVSKERLPVIVAGDFNSSLWSPWFRDFVRYSGLKTAAFPSVLIPTWPSPFPVFLRIPIDRILATGRIEIRDYHVLPSIHSDHRPVRACLRISPNR